ncbi:Na+ dependent nucleoside transporter domain protein [Desulfatibacillum aliphaticivorans]|uniref:Na+ dependent nucleoside transporter domain protein n=1 Tax=Desulfatibacillum aliphaticivorans TaxID=218208 RepID=B8FI83_DESAL|nr:nucleoside transporter C-terminal domain-containing protein [Desulfatibacillum aliphaticivorans]ACL02650.1 Na+ dependent nucleoside transporter domain protein [Desulfatibacillum aliphaticivorans]
MLDILHCALGLIAMPLIALAFSENRKNIQLKTVISAIVLQLILALVFLKMPGAQSVFLALNKVVGALETAARAGTTFVFGYLGGGESFPFEVTNQGASYIFGLRGLWLILVMSALSSLLFYWKILPLIVRGFAWLLRRSLGVGGAEGLGLAANVFVGMIEAPLFVKPYLRDISRGELFALMTGGMATVAGTVLVLYASFLKPVLPDALGHLLVASIISAPAAIAVARIMIPSDSVTEGQMSIPNPASSSMEAITNGGTEGMKLYLNVIAMLVVCVAMVELVNICLGWVPNIGGEAVTLQRILGMIMAPIVWLIGIPWSECVTAGSLMGVKTVLNEFLSYLALAGTPAEQLSPRSVLIMTYAMCGFANLGSLGIMIGGLGMMVPERRTEIVGLGFKSIIAGTLATLMTGAIAGILFSG